MRFRRWLMLAAVVLGVAGLCASGLALAQTAPAPTNPPVSGQSATWASNFYAWRQNNYLAGDCQNWGHGDTCGFTGLTGYDLAFQLTGTITTTTGSAPISVNQLDKANEYSPQVVSNLLDSTHWSLAADDFTITTTTMLTETITDIKVFGVGIGGSALLGTNVTVCFYSSTGTLPFGLPSGPGACQTGKPTSVSSNDNNVVQYFTFHLSPPQAYPYSASGQTEWFSVQTNSASDWYWFLANYPFAWTNFLFLPFVRR